jgi:hypothetical protein
VRNSYQHKESKATLSPSASFFCFNKQTILASIYFLSSPAVIFLCLALINFNTPVSNVPVKTDQGLHVTEQKLLMLMMLLSDGKVSLSYFSVQSLLLGQCYVSFI